jgi:hypothetical protein
MRVSTRKRSSEFGWAVPVVISGGFVEGDPMSGEAAVLRDRE